jgi:F0F1-type ATP synthase assembly protein I
MFPISVIAAIVLALGVVLLFTTVAGVMLYHWTGGAMVVNFILSLGLMLFGGFILKLERIEEPDASTDLSNQISAELSDKAKLIASIRHLVIAVAAGVLTSLIFLLIYHAIDFSADVDISERKVRSLCPALPNLPSDSEIVKGMPSLFSMVPEFAGLGIVAGIVIGLFLRKWQELLSIVFRRRALAWLSNASVATVMFGVLWGFLLGGIFNTAFFGVSDGRPFMSITTAGTSAVISVLAYVSLLYVFLRRNTAPVIINRIMVLVCGCVILGVSIYYIDLGLHLTQRAYCHFYEAWDTRRNLLQVDFKVWLVASIYGAAVGFTAMVVAAAYQYLTGLHYQASQREQVWPPTTGAGAKTGASKTGARRGRKR